MIRINMILTGLKGVVIIHSQFSGAVAQLGERMNGIHEAVGSIPSSSTRQKQKGLRKGKPFFISLKGRRSPSSNLPLITGWWKPYPINAELSS
jgi:hypothetical protein